jgi:hypothetical protein
MRIKKIREKIKFFFSKKWSSETKFLKEGIEESDVNMNDAVE